jgi:tight adherence protein C
MAVTISITLFLMLMAGITLYGYKRYAKPARIYEQLGPPVIANQPSSILDATTETEEGVVVRFLHQIGEYVPISPEDASNLRRLLIMAGYRTDRAVTIFYGVKIVLGISLVILAFLFKDMVTDNSVLRMVLVVAGGFVGFAGPNFVLDRMITKRQERLRLSLPDALDLMVVSVEAGLGLDQAIQHVARELQVSHREISEELSLVNLEMRAGKRRSEALKNLGERTGEPELKKLIAILIQNDRFGTSMAESLRSHSDFLRVRRRQEAEERAGKVGVKLVFPIFFFILPSMLVVSAGPGLLQVFKNLFPMMRNFGQ